MTERKDTPMTISDTDIERAIQRNLTKLEKQRNGRMPISADAEDGSPVGDDVSKD
jgi:hypothetical protein